MPESAWAIASLYGQARTNLWATKADASRSYRWRPGKVAGKRALGTETGTIHAALLEPVAHGPGGLQAAGRRIKASCASLVSVADMSGHSSPCPDTPICAHSTAVFREPQVGAIFAFDQTTFRSL
jgi:hypothetical protein